MSLDVVPPWPDVDGERRGVVRRRVVRFADVRRVVRFAARRAVLRDPPFFRDAFLLLLALRDLAVVLAFLRRFFAMRAPSNECARILAPVVT